LFEFGKVPRFIRLGGMSQTRNSTRPLQIAARAPL